jgi:hypothetical protein
MARGTSWREFTGLISGALFTVFAATTPAWSQAPSVESILAANHAAVGAVPATGRRSSPT